MFLKMRLPMNAATDRIKISGTKKYAPYPNTPSKNELTAMPTSPKINERVARIKKASAENNAPTAPILSFVISAFSLFFFPDAAFSSAFFPALSFSSFKVPPPNQYNLDYYNIFFSVNQGFRGVKHEFFLVLP